MNTFEIIKEAAKKKDRIENHKQKIKKAGTAGRVMQMAYIDKKGKYSERFVEPYKIDGDSFWGYSLDKNEIRRFKIPQIDNLKITNKKYQPRWPVEVDYEGMTKTAAQKKKYIAVDFDGTICENAFPDIGAAKKSTVEFMRIMAEEGHVIIIWTCRSGKYLDEAKAFLDKNKIPYKYINENPEVDFQTSNKIYADYYVDDKAINVNSLMDIDEYSKLQANRSYWTSKQYEFDENGKIPALEEAFSDPLEKKIAYMIATSHEYKKPNAKAAISFVKNYKWEESETSVSNLQGINKPINEEKVADMVKTIKNNIKPLICVNQFHGIRPQTPGKKILIDGHHRLEAEKRAGIDKTPIYKGTYTGAAEKDVNELINSSEENVKQKYAEKLLRLRQRRGEIPGTAEWIEKNSALEFFEDFIEKEAAQIVEQSNVVPDDVFYHASPVQDIKRFRRSEDTSGNNKGRVIFAAKHPMFSAAFGTRWNDGTASLDVQTSDKQVPTVDNFVGVKLKYTNAVDLDKPCSMYKLKGKFKELRYENDLEFYTNEDVEIVSEEKFKTFRDMAEAYGLELERVSNKFIDEKLQAKKSTNFEKVAMFEEEIEKEAKAESQFRKLQDNKVSLTPEERKQCLDAKAVWHYNGGGPTPAVWKSINKETGEVTYVTHTHRAYNTAPTLKGAIGRFHKFIKGTA